MKRYKAIFDLPDNLIPPPTVGFSVLVSTGQSSPNEYAQQLVSTPLLPVAFCAIDEDGKFVEVVGKGET